MSTKTAYALWVNPDETEWCLCEYRSASDVVKDVNGRQMSLFALFEAASWEEAVSTKERLMDAHHNVN